MPTPDPIGPIHFSEPRAVVVRDPKELSSTHAAVHGDMNVYTETVAEAQAIIAAWPVIMQKAADEAQAILSAMRNVNNG